MLRAIGTATRRRVSKGAFRRRWRNAFSRWVWRRQGVDALPLRLNSRRLYILPTRVGVTFGIVCLSMLLGSMNYNNSMGFALTFLLTAVGLVAMHRCHRTLAGLKIIDVQTARAFAGEPLPLQVVLLNDGAQTRYEVRASIGEQRSAVSDLEAGAEARLEIDLPTHQRGLLRLRRVSLNTRFPLSLLRAWCWLYIRRTAVVWPQPAADAPPRPLLASDQSGQRSGRGDDDFAGLRDYQQGDSPRLIAWKTFARSNELKSRRFEGGAQATSWIDYAATGPLPLEERLSVLCRWVLDAEASSDNYGLRLPGIEIAPGRGAMHRDACLDALARCEAPEYDYEV